MTSALPKRIAPESHQTVVSLLRRAAHINADLEAYVEPSLATDSRRSITFAEWDRAADGVAGFLESRGVVKGDVVCLLLPSSIDYAVLYAALLRLGAITSGINPRMGPHEIASILERVTPTLLVAESATIPDWSNQSIDVLEREQVRETWGDDPPTQWPELTAGDPVAIVWTSGTTGHPKGALFDHTNLMHVARGTDAMSQVGDRKLSPIPFAHTGYMTRAWDEISNAITTIITPSPWRADDALRILSSEGVTVAQGVPTQYTLMLSSPEFVRTDLSSLRVATTGAARVPSALLSEIRERFGVPVVVRYTSTESSIGTGTTLSSSEEEVARTVGRPVTGVELAIVDDDGTRLAHGDVGKVLLRSRAVMRGYWGREPSRGRPLKELIDGDATAAVLSPDGWLTTGDFGRLTSEGCLQLSGRTHERYIRGGYNVYPAEVEETLLSHPTVAQVAVIGMPDDVLGEIGVAVVVAADHETPELDSLRSHSRESLSDYKAPDVLVVVEDLPLTAMMKVDRAQLAHIALNGVEQRRLRLRERRLQPSEAAAAVTADSKRRT